MNLVGMLQEFSDRLGPFVADHLWQASVFAALAGAVTMLLRKAPARARHGVWLMASLKIALPSAALTLLAGAAGLGRPALHGPLVPAEEARAFLPEPLVSALALPIERVAAPFSAEPTPAREGPAGAGRFPWAALGAGLWATGSLFLFVRHHLARRRVARAVASGRLLPAGRERAALARARVRVGTIRDVPLRASNAFPQPGVRGIRHPVLVLPEGVADRLSDDELESVFVHELEHIRRRDNLIADLHLGLCCLFWFYPVVWLIDRRLLQERERACDDEVLRRSCPPAVYASGLLKVFTFGLGPRAAGVSAAAGTALRDRVARMAAGAASPRLTAAHRMLVSASAAALVLVVLAGLSGASESSAGQPAPAPSAPPPVAAPAATPAPSAGFAPGEASAGRPPVAPEQVARSVPRPIAFENPGDAPLRIRAASVRLVPLDSSDDPESRDEVMVTPPALRLDNISGRRVVFVRVDFQARGRFRDVVGFDVGIDPGAPFLLEPAWRSWSNTIDRRETDLLAARIAGVRFADGGAWGTLEEKRAPAPAPPAPGAATPAPGTVIAPEATATPAPTAAADPAGKAYPARFENPANAPVVILDARTIADRPAPGCARLPILTLRNTTDRRVTHLKLRFKAGTPAHAVTAFPIDLPPGSTIVWNRSGSDVEGDPADVRVQLLGVRFDNGDEWGAFDTSIDTRREFIDVPQFIHAPDP